ncbi:MAG: helix-turn-helix transcriptional regulator [Defluviitaleaceae bacterium]|nr:helix-turn-helix transcriptional regulator [Defluviitaleaceae bacterium]
MDTQEAVAFRISQLCKEKGFSIHGIAIYAAVPPATIRDILVGKTKNPGVTTIKKLCDGLGITLGEFFSTPEFDNLEQEIR